MPSEQAREPHGFGWPAALVLVLLGALLYLPGVSAPFIYDDNDAIVTNHSIRSLTPLFAVLRPPPDTPISGRPLVNLSFAVSYAISGLDPAGYRLLNLAFHLLNALLVLGLMRFVLARPSISPRLRAERAGLSLCIAALFVVHPLQTEAVHYVTQRSELMAASCYLGTLWLSARSFVAPVARPWQWAAIALAAIAPFVKEMTVSVPLLVLLLDRALVSASLRDAFRQHLRLYLGFSLSLLATALQLISLPRGQSAGFLAPTPEYLATQGAVITRYLRLCVWPVGQSIAHDFEVATSLTRYWPQDLLVASLLVATLWVSRRRLALALPGWLMYAVLAPSSSVIPVLTEIAAERRMYLPLVGLIALGVIAVHAALGAVRGLPRVVAPALALAILAGFATLSAVRLQDYRGSEQIWRAALAVDPHNRIARQALAYELVSEERREPARALLRSLIDDRRPFRGPAAWCTRALFNLATIDDREGLHAQAGAERTQALACDPESAIGQLHRAAVERMRGHLVDAQRILVAMLDQPYLHGHVYEALADLLALRGDLVHARQLAQKALALDPDRMRARALLEQSAR